MPLLDHFHRPLFPTYPWESFHGAWATQLMGYLNRLLPRRYLATTTNHFGAQVAADVAESALLELPAATASVALTFPDDLEVQVIDEREGVRLVAVVELVSPRNKDRQDARDAFTAKCCAYLQRGVGVVVVDIVTSRHANLHNELMRRLNAGSPAMLPDGCWTYAASYRPAQRQQTSEADVWTWPLKLGEMLPTVPLRLLGATPVPLVLEGTYQAACSDSRI
jgi:hypothetical protein